MRTVVRKPIQISNGFTFNFIKMVISPLIGNRWAMLVPAFATHVCLGAPYGWSSISAQLAREGGIVASCSSDWSLDATAWPMAIMIASGGISAALLGSWTVRVGVF